MKIFSSLLLLCSAPVLRAGFWNSIFNLEEPLLYRLYLEELRNCPNGSSVVNVASFHLTEKNSYSYHASGSVEVTQDIPRDALINVGVLRMVDGQWEDYGYSVNDVNICDFIEKDTRFYPAIQAQTNLPTKCPLKKGAYSANGGNIKFDHLPFLLPYGCFKLLATIRDKIERPLACFYFLVQISSPISDSKCSQTEAQENKN